MADRLTPEQRSANMSRIRDRDTSIEVAVRKWLFAHGFRYRKNDRRYPGKPDILLPRYHAAIFINGCFWHRHPGCRLATMPSSRVEFWQSKFERNVRNDDLHRRQLEEMSWRVITVWECELRKSIFEERMEKLAAEILSSEDGKAV